MCRGKPDQNQSDGQKIYPPRDARPEVSGHVDREDKQGQRRENKPFFRLQKEGYDEKHKGQETDDQRIDEISRNDRLDAGQQQPL